MGAIYRVGRLHAALIGAALIAAVLFAAAIASALELRAGDILVNAESGFSPHSLPRTHNAPITVHGGGTISTISGALPPVLKTIALEFDRHGAVQTTGLPICTVAKLKATTPLQARHICPNAIVGEGEGKAVIAFPESRPFSVSTPITIFNGPRQHGAPTAIAHAYLSVPIPTTYIVPIVIERVHDGVYGYRVRVNLPSIAGGAGVPISGSVRVGRKWAFKGHRYSYLSARCETGRLQARGEFSFSDGNTLFGTFLRACKVRR
jgi:hypothetical protein